MLRLVLFEDEGYRNLLPLTYWRTCGELRTGYARLLDHARQVFRPVQLEILCRPELVAVTSGRLAETVNRTAAEPAFFCNARLLAAEPPLDGPCPAVQWHQDTLLAVAADHALAARLSAEVLLDPAAARQTLAGLPTFDFFPRPRLLNYPWDLVHANHDALLACWTRLGSPNGILGLRHEGVHVLNPAAVFVDAGSVLKPGAVLDAEHGPVYIGRNVTVSSNTTIEGPCFIGDGTIVQPGAVLRDGMSIGPRCKVGGELESSILHGYSNKQHDGFLGHAYVAEWVNLAADTVNSDLKNTYGPVRVPINGREIDSGRMFVGLTIADHSKTGIGQMFPTGAVVGFGSNIATCEFSPKFVPSFTWVTGAGATPYAMERCLEVARKVMLRREIQISAAEEAWFRELPEYACRFEQPSWRSLCGNPAPA